MRNSISAIYPQTQVQEVRPVVGKSFYELLKSIAHEYGSYVNHEFTVDIHNLDIATKRLILSYIIDSDEYQWACSSPTRTEALYKEHIDYIADKMVHAEYEAYVEIMEESGRIRESHKDNGESYWRSL